MGQIDHRVRRSDVAHLDGYRSHIKTGQRKGITADAARRICCHAKPERPCADDIADRDAACGGVQRGDHWSSGGDAHRGSVGLNIGRG